MYYICNTYHLDGFTYGKKYFLTVYRFHSVTIDDNNERGLLNWLTVNESFISIDKHRKSIIKYLL